MKRIRQNAMEEEESQVDAQQEFSSSRKNFQSKNPRSAWMDSSSAIIRESHQQVGAEETKNDDRSTAESLEESLVQTCMESMFDKLGGNSGVGVEVQSQRFLELLQLIGLDDVEKQEVIRVNGGATMLDSLMFANIVKPLIRRSKTLENLASVGLINRQLLLNSIAACSQIKDSLEDNQMSTDQQTVPSVFLGGACNPTTWRQDLAMPLLESYGVTYYNPQVEAWSPDLVPLEAFMKENCPILLFVIGKQTRSIASMIEASEYIASKRLVVLVIEPLETKNFAQAELKDLQRGREYLKDVATRHSVQVFESIPSALNHIKVVNTHFLVK